MKHLPIIMILISVISGCATTERIVDKKTPEVKALLGCTAGALSSYKIEGSLESDLDKAVSEKKLNLSSSVEINDWVKGYIFEKIPQTDALEAYKLYLGCYEKEIIRHSAGYDPQLIPFIASTENLWKKWDEAIKYNHPLEITKAEAYALEGKRLNQLNEEELDAKNNILKYDKEALMYFLAGEIIARNENASDRKLYFDQAVEYSNKCITAGKSGQEWYLKMVQGNISEKEKEWIEREEINMVTKDRLAECYAQSAFFGNKSARTKLSNTLAKLPCSYIKKYQFLENIVYKRIGLPQEIVSC